MTNLVYDYAKSMLFDIQNDGDFSESDKIRQEIITFVKPHAFGGKDGIDIAIQKDYAMTRLIVQKAYNSDILQMNVLEYHLTIEKLKKDAKSNKNVRTGSR